MNLRTVNIPILVVYSIFLLNLFSCGTGDVTGTSETGNAKMAGTVVTNKGEPVEGLILTLLPKSYSVVEQGIPASEYLDTTNSEGEYCFSLENSGDYVLSSFTEGSTNDTLGLLVSGLEILPKETVQRRDTAVSIHPMKLETNKTPEQGRYYIRGTLLQSGSELVNELAFIPSVPAALLPSIYFYDAENSNDIKIFNDNYITISPDDDNIFNGFEDWLYWCRYMFPTDSGGMKIDNDVSNVLIPLYLEFNSKFKYEEALVDGRDVRFYNDHGKEVPYSAVSYDSALGSAEIWISYETLEANRDTSQHVTMVWGKADAPLKDYSSEVYSAAGGYVSYWHCDSGATLKDYTDKAHNGTLQSVDFVDGIRGKGLNFDGDGKQSYVDISSTNALKTTDNVTVVAWVKPSRDGQDWESIFSFMADAGEEESGYSLTFYNGQWRFMVCTEVQTPNSIVYAPGTDQVKVGEWNHLVGTYDGAMIRFYLNGEEVASKAESGKIDWIYEPLSCRIGMFEGAHETGYFNGALDEVQVLNRAVSADWVKVNYAALK